MVENHLDATMEHLQKIPKPMEDKAAKALASVEEEVRKDWDKIADWQKKIKIANSSELSWGILVSCKSSDLALYSAD